jgi:hypothetical protein
VEVQEEVAGQVCGWVGGLESSHWVARWHTLVCVLHWGWAVAPASRGEVTGQCTVAAGLHAPPAIPSW